MTFDTDAANAGNQSTLDFTTSNWSTPQTVTVSASQDADKTNDTAEITITSPGLASKSLTVTVMDDEDVDVGLILSLESSAELIRIDEGNPVPRTLMVKLAAQPGNDRTLTLQSVYSQVTLNPSELRFTTANWNTYQQFGITAERDDDSINAADLIRLDGPGVTARTITLSIIDYDGREENSLILSDTSLTLDEGAGETFTVKLAAQVQTDRTITLTSDNSAVTVTPAALDFTPANWNETQTVTVSAAHDADQNNESATVSLTGFHVSAASVAVSVTDDDIGLTMSPSSLTVNEGGTGTFTVRLAAQPENNRTVNLASTNSDVTISPTQLTFSGGSNGDWNTAQTVTVTAAEDADATDETATVNLTGDGIVPGSMAVSVRDADITLTLSSASLTVEEGGTETFTVRLASQPQYDRQVSLAPTNPDVSVSPTQLTFTGGGNGNWNTAQTVTITAAQDTDKTDDSATINLAGAGIAPASATVLELDDDIGLTFSPASLTLVEGGSATFTVELASRPGNDRTVNLASANPDLTISPTELTFTGGSGGNWSTARTVTVSAGQDADKANDDAAVNFTGAGITADSVEVLITDDDDTDVGLTLSESSLTVNEGGANTFTVQLAAQPGNARSISLSSANPEVTLSPGTLNFTAAEWDSPQTVTVTAAQDADRANDTADISITGSGVTSSTLTVTVMDDEDTDVGLTLSVSWASVIRLDEGTSRTFEIRLAAQPGNGRTVSLQSLYSQVTLSPSTLQFTTANWNETQQFTITAVQDDDSENVLDGVRLGGASIVSRTMLLSIIDDDKPANRLVLSPTSLTVEEGASETFTVRLASQAENNRTITLSSDNSAVTVTPGALNFTGGNWNAPQTVTVAAAEDSDRLNTSATISLAGFRVTDASLAVTVLDDEDEDVGLTLSLQSLAVPLEIEEGGSTALTVRLASRPANDRVVTLESPDSAVTFSPASLRFTPDNWDEPQELRIIAGQDDDTENNVARAVLGGIGVIGRTIPLIIYDDDKAEISLTVSAASLTLDEGDKGTFTVRLSTEPESGRAVLLESTSPDVTVSPGVLSFGTSDWDAPRTVTVTTVQDSDRLNISATINLTGFRVTDASLAVTVLDDEDEDVGLTLSLKSLAVPLGVEEGGSTALTVRLASQPANGRTVTLQSPDSVVTFSPASLQFTPDNWDEPQELRIIAGQDDDSDNNISRATFAGIGVIARTIPLIIYDDDRVEIGLTVSAASLTLDEGDTGTFTVRLSAEPEDGRAVLLKSTNPDVTVSLATAGFSSQNWNIPQTITITAGHDDDTANDRATINLTGGGVTSASVAVTVNDDDVELTLSSTSLKINEGGSGTFTVKLSEQPSADVTLTLTLYEYSDLIIDTNPEESGNQTTLTFTSGDEGSWKTAKTVMVTAGQDNDGDDDEATISLSGSGVTSASVAVTVNDDDVGLTLSSKSLQINEYGSGTFTVKLSEQPSADVTLVLAVYGSTDVTVDTDLATAGRQNTLTFTSGDGGSWQIAKTVMLIAWPDDDGDDDEATIILIGSGVTSASVAVTVDDDDVGLTLSAKSLKINEGGSGTFTVKLSEQPSADVTLILAVYGSTDVTVDTDDATEGNQTTLTFTSGDEGSWKIAKTVTVTAGQDDDGDDDEATIILYGGEGVGTSSVKVTVTDDDAGGAGFNVSGVLRQLQESDAEILAVRLAVHPGNSRTDNLQILRRSNFMLNPDRIASGSLSSLHLKVDVMNISQAEPISVKPGNGRADDTPKAHFPEACPVDTLLSKLATDADMASMRNFSVIPPLMQVCGRAILAVKRFTPSPQEKTGLSP